MNITSIASTKLSHVTKIIATQTSSVAGQARPAKVGQTRESSRGLMKAVQLEVTPKADYNMVPMKRKMSTRHRAKLIALKR